MRVAFDATALLGRRTGIGNCTAEVIKRLPRPDLDLVAFAVSARGAGALTTMVPTGVSTVTRPMAARPLRAAWRRNNHPKIEWWTGPVDVVHGPNFVVPPSRAAEIVTVHDLTCVRFPELCTSDTLQLPSLIERAISRGAWVHTVSSFVADEVIAHFEASLGRSVHPREICMIGDRVLTDVMFGNQYGMLSVLVGPLSLIKDHPLAVIIRWLETKLLLPVLRLLGVKPKSLSSAPTSR
jgi:hypothetical protein